MGTHKQHKQPYRITATSDKWYDEFYKIYKVSFPVFEQRNKEQQEYAFNHDNYFLDYTVDDDKFLSFIAYWDFNKYIYIEHLAVNPDYRGENIGSRVLREFIESKNKVILLEIDPLTTDIALKRFRFYERLGFQENIYPHFHPPYDKHYPAHELIVLSYGHQIDKSLYETFYNDLSKIVMQVS